MRTRQRVILGAILLVVVAALRLPWREADGGTTGFWSYGVFTTDEGNYTSGGRLAYQTGSFVDAPLSEPHTFLHGWGMHALAWLGYEVGGVSMGSARLPTIIMAVVGWCLAYWLASRWTLPAIAFVVTLVVSCNPMSLVYERIVMGHVIIGSLALLAYVTVTSRKTWPSMMAGMALAVAVSVKVTALAFLPMVLLALVKKKRRAAWFVAGFVVLFGLSYAWREMVFASVPVSGAGDSQGQMKLVGGLMSWDAAAWLRAVSYFPRWPVGMQMGVLFVWAFALPVWYLAIMWRRTGRWMTTRGVVPLGVLIYLVALGSQTTAPPRYFLPVFYFVPALVVRARCLAEPLPVKRLLLIGVAAVVMFLLYWLPSNWPVTFLREFVANEYIVPARSAWVLDGHWLVVSFVAVMIALCRGWGLRDWMSCGIMALVLVSLFFDNHALAVNRMVGGFPMDQGVMQAALVVMFGCCFVRVARRCAVWLMMCGLLFLVFALANSPWRSAWPELMSRRFLERSACEQLAHDLPKDAIIVGRRSPTLMRASACRLGLCLAGYTPGEFTRRLQELLALAPEQPLFLLVEADAAGWYYPKAEEIRAQMEMKLVTTLSVPSDSSPQPIPISLYRLERRALP